MDGGTSISCGVSISLTIFVYFFFCQKTTWLSHQIFAKLLGFFRQNSGDENERILMTKPGLSHNVSLLSNCWRRQVKKDLFDKQNPRKIVNFLEKVALLCDEKTITNEQKKI